MTQIGSKPEPVDKLETAIADLLDMPQAIVLPSARFGIWAALKLLVPEGQAVAVPALNCSAVYEAAIRSGLHTEFADCQHGSLLMNLGTTPRVYASILSELYGQTYELTSGMVRPAICIFDMAMTIPERHLLHRLSSSDLALFSFGLGKCGYAGWGGVALTHDRSFSRELRRIVRDSCTGKPASWFNAKRTLTLGARVMAHWSPFYRFARTFQDLRHPPRRLLIPPENWHHDGTQGEEWRRLPVVPELKMLARNLKTFPANAAVRRKLEHQFRESFRGIDGITLPTPSVGVLSHFTIRVPAATKEPIRQGLWRHGIDAGDVIGLPSYCDPAVFPNAFKASQELLNLPIDPKITAGHIQTIADILSSVLSTN